MFEKSITNDADKMICTLYKEYLNKRKDGVSKSKAKYFGDFEEIKNNYFSKMNPDDLADTLFELSRNEFISEMSYDNVPNRITLTDETIVYMENRFKKGASEVIEFLTKFV